MTERKVIKVKRQAIRRARLKKVGTVAAMLPLVMSKGAPVATLIRGRHGEAALGIEQVVERAEQEIADVVLPETPAEEVLEEKEYGGVEEREVQEAPTPFEAPQYFVAPYFSEGGLTSFEGDDAYLDIVPLAVNWDARGTWPWAEVLNVRWISATRVEIKFSRTLSDNSTRGGGQIKDLELKVEVGDDVFTDVQLISQSGNEIYTIELEGISQEAFGSITIYFGDPDGRPGKDNSFRLQGGYGVLHPNPFFPIVITEKHIRLGRVVDKFVNDPLAADVVQWPQLALTEIGFSGSLDFIDKIADIVFASTDAAGASHINYGAVEWGEIATAIETALYHQSHLPQGQYYEVDLSALQAAFTGTGLFEEAQVCENVPVALQEIALNRGQVAPRPFDGTRIVRQIDEHISLDFEIEMANGERMPIMELEVQLSEDILLHDRAGLWATFVHLEGHEAQRRAVHEAVTQAVTKALLPHDLSEELLQQLTDRIIAQSAVNNTGNANGLYDGQITLADEGFTPTIIGGLQSVPNKEFDNNNFILSGESEYTFEFAIMGNNPSGGGELRFATATLVIAREDLKFANVHVGTHKIVVQPQAYKSLEFTAGTYDAFDAEDLQAFLAQYRAQIEANIQTLADHGGLFSDASITPRPVTWVAGTVADKDYDGTTDVLSFVPPRLEGFVDGDSNIIEVDFGELAERLRFENSLPGTWSIEGLDFHEDMLERQDHVGNNTIFNYRIIGTPAFIPATIYPLILDIDDVHRLNFTKGEVSRQYDGTEVYTGFLRPLNVTIDGVAEDDDNIYQFIFSSDGFLRFDERHVTNGHVSVYLEDASIELVRQGGRIQPVELSPILQEHLRHVLFLGEITPRELFWGRGIVEDKAYDGTVVAHIIEMPQLFSTSESAGDFAIYAGDKTGQEYVRVYEGLAEYESRDVVHNAQGGVIAQPVVATGIAGQDRTIGGGDYARNYVLVPRPGAETIGFDLSSNVFGQSAFGMPNFFYDQLLKPSFSDATIYPLEVHFTGGSLRNNSREYAGMPISPARDEFNLPSLSTVLDDKQAILDQELGSRITAVEGNFAHKNNLNVGTARSELAGWDIEGEYSTNYRLIDSPAIEWEITVQEVYAWDNAQIVGAQSGFATKVFDDTTYVTEAHILHLPRLAGEDLDIDGWDLSFDDNNVIFAQTLTIGNMDVVREQLNDLLGPNQKLSDGFDFASLFEAKITPRVLTWTMGRIPSRHVDGTNAINLSEVVVPDLIGIEHEILDNHVQVAYDLDGLVFRGSAVGSYEFNWYEDAALRVVFADPRHESNYIVPELGTTWATILPLDIDKVDVSYNFTVESREYDGRYDITENNFVAEIILEGGYEIQLPYRVEGLRFEEVHAGTDVLEFDALVFDEKLYEFFAIEDEGEIRERILQEILVYRNAQITPRQIEWTVGTVANKEWDGTDEVHQILIAPELSRHGNRNEVAIVARDKDYITVEKGWANFSQTAVGDEIPVNSDDNWELLTADDHNHPLQNYTFGSPYEGGEIPQPEFMPANINSVTVTEVQPMPENPEYKVNNVLYIETGYIQRQYNGNAKINLDEDMRSKPVFALRNAQGKEIPLSLDNLVNLEVVFFDKDVAYTNGEVDDKEILTSIERFEADDIVLSDNGLREIERLLFIGRITPWVLHQEYLDDGTLTLEGNRMIRKVYDGKENWRVPEWPDPDNLGQTFKDFPELWVKFSATGEIIPLLFGDDYAITFEDRHAGSNKPVAIDGFYLASRNVALGDDLRDYMRNHLLTGQIDPMTIRWTQGQVERRSYDGTETAVVTSMPELPILPIDLENDGIIIQTGTARFDTMDVRFDSAGNVVAMPVHATGIGDDWSISGENSGNYWLQTPIHSVLNSLIPTRQTLSTVVPRPVQRVSPLFENQIIDPIRLTFNGRKIAERVFNYDSYFTVEDLSYEYGIEAGFANPEKWINVETGQPMNAIGDYYLTLRIVDQMSRLANGQPHVAEDELVFVDAQGNEVGRGDVRVELRDEQGNINRNYEYVFDEEVEMIGRILKAQGLPVTRPQAARVTGREIELFHSTLTQHQPLVEAMPFIFEPFSFGEADAARVSRENLFVPAIGFDPGPYLIEYAVSMSDNPEHLTADDWQMSTLFTGLTPATEYFLFARQADHHNRYAGAIISGLASVVTLAELSYEPAPENGAGKDNGNVEEETRRPGEINGADKQDQPNDYLNDEKLSKEETPTEDPVTREEEQEEGTQLPRTGEMIASGLGIAGLITLASAAILRKKKRKE